MKIPEFSHWVRWSQAFALLVCGMIIGAAAFMLVYQHNMNEVLAVNDTLRREKKELELEIVDLEKYKDKNTIIKSIVVDIEEHADDPTLNEVVRNKIIAQVKEHLSVFKGKPISFLADANVSQVSRILFGQRRISDVQDKDYQVEIKTMLVVYGELKVRITAREWKNRGGE